MTTTYSRGDAILLDGAPGVVLEAKEGGQLVVSTFPRMEGLMGDRHPGLAPLEEPTSAVVAERIAAIRAHYGIEVTR